MEDPAVHNPVLLSRVLKKELSCIKIALMFVFNSMWIIFPTYFIGASASAAAPDTPIPLPLRLWKSSPELVQVVKIN